MNLAKLHQWHQSRKGLLLVGLVELVVAYTIGSRALDTGSLIEYFLAIVFFVGGLHNLAKLIGTVYRGNKAAKTR